MAKDDKTLPKPAPATAEYIVLKGTIQIGIFRPTGEGRPPMQVLKSYGPGSAVILNVEEAQDLIAEGLIRDPSADLPPPAAPRPANAAPVEGVTISQDGNGPKVGEVV